MNRQALIFACYFIMREEQTIVLLEKRVLRRISGPKREEEEGW
jgi:hypothetical protein